jgi:hypothetical protein
MNVPATAGALPISVVNAIMATPLVNCVMLFTACLPVFVNHRHHTAANSIANLPCYSVSAKFKPRAETIDRGG